MFIESNVLRNNHEFVPRLSELWVEETVRPFFDYGLIYMTGFSICQLSKDMSSSVMFEESANVIKLSRKLTLRRI